MKAIVYTSNTGTTKEYAKLLSDKLSLPYYSLDPHKSYFSRFLPHVYD